MTAFVPDTPLRVVATLSGTRALRIEIEGDLDFSTADGLVATVRTQMEDNPDVRDLELACGGMGVCDSAGLAALLMVRRRTSAAGVHLSLTGRSAQLDRLLDITGTLHHLTGASAETAKDQQREQDQEHELPRQ
ncbi:anti-anti-sigma factor [Actinomadura coerulea]|uniref:Anti-anti-sigma factor n=1 Tax=Actinomadura coerulea TaxID=46159 RepID=A0A7X0G6Y4_9ACTN|nr:STAS domain-containing protein [Actinomadura coerulea]MBB6399386.1 anti-anti-sigma factor [Actinomadura coerulea]GGQ28535.1 sulfate transporter [Actinomadura coerulea]